MGGLLQLYSAILGVSSLKLYPSAQAHTNPWPEIASRKHIEKIKQVIESAPSEAGMTLDQTTAGGSPTKSNDYRQDHQNSLYDEQYNKQGYDKFPPLFYLDTSQAGHDGREAGRPHNVGQPVAKLEG